MEGEEGAELLSALCDKSVVVLVPAGLAWSDTAWRVSGRSWECQSCALSSCSPLRVLSCSVSSLPSPKPRNLRCLFLQLSLMGQELCWRIRSHCKAVPISSHHCLALSLEPVACPVWCLQSKRLMWQNATESQLSLHAAHWGFCGGITGRPWLAIPVG